jgi:pyruvate, water dikinase
MQPRGSPFPDVATPPGCEGWEEMYPRHALFGEQPEREANRFWFRDGLHWAEPIRPFDAVVVDWCTVAFSQASTRLFAVPQSLGIEYRIHNGHDYVTVNTVADPAVVARRAEEFAERAGFYYEHWDDIYAGWVRRVEAATTELRALEVPDLPELEDMEIVRTGRGWGSSHALLTSYQHLLGALDRVLQYHFELLGLGYGAYLSFYELCREAFPDVSDQTLSTMVSGIDVLTQRPDEELSRLAALALELGVGDAVKAAESESGLREALAPSEAGARWLARLDAAKDPWFYFSYGNGLSSHHRSWIDDTTLPISIIGSYVGRIELGEDVSRPRDAVIAERDRVTAEYRSLVGDDARRAFDERLALARTVFPYVENHNFYIDHVWLTIFWNKVREFGALLAKHGFLEHEEEVFFLRHDELPSALEELRMQWSTGSVTGSRRWRDTASRRQSILESLRAWPAPPALGRPPDEVADPIAVMLWGVTPERVRGWLNDTGTGRAVSGVAASAGVAEGRARVVLHPDGLGELEDGEVLIAPSTSPSWTPVFGRLAAAVSETGGVMCHAAIVAREYGLPAVVGAINATSTIKTGTLVRVDGGTGVITILE